MKTLSVNEKIGKWTIININDKKCLCQCECGIKQTISYTSLVRKTNLQCKECSNKSRLRIKVGDVIGEWTVINTCIPAKRIGGHLCCEVQCSCGTTKQIGISSLLNDRTKKCKRCSNKEKGRQKTKIYAGQQIGDWTVLEVYSKTNEDCSVCRCKCGIVKNVIRTFLSTGKSFKCVDCFHKSRIGSGSPTWTGYKEITGIFWNNIKRSAEKRKIDFDITIEEVWELFLKQDRRCALTGIKLFFPLSKNGVRNASLDRIDSKKGYIKGNIQWTHKYINVMKTDLSQKDFIAYCKLVAKHNS